VGSKPIFILRGRPRPRRTVCELRRSQSRAISDYWARIKPETNVDACSNKSVNRA
jgi:hypothetical protein